MNLKFFLWSRGVHKYAEMANNGLKLGTFAPADPQTLANSGPISVAMPKGDSERACQLAIPGEGTVAHSPKKHPSCTYRHAGKVYTTCPKKVGGLVRRKKEDRESGEKVTGSLDWHHPPPPFVTLLRRR